MSRRCASLSQPRTPRTSVNSMPAINRDVALEDMTDTDFDEALTTGQRQPSDS